MTRPLVHLCLAILLLPLQWPGLVCAAPPLPVNTIAVPVTPAGCPCCPMKRPATPQPDREPAPQPESCPPGCPCLFCTTGFLVVNDPPLASGWIDTPTGFVCENLHVRVLSGFRLPLDRSPRLLG